MKTPNNSATGGYLLPSPQAPSTGNLTLEQFIQTALVGVSGLPGQLVRPKWQKNPPKYPDIDTNWVGFYLMEDDADTYIYNDINTSGNNVFQRMEKLLVQCSFYGPDAHHVGKLVRDGFQIGQNREALQSVKMDFISTGKLTRAPDLINERWENRWEMAINFNHEELRTYPILYFLSVSGILITEQGAGVRTTSWNVPKE